MDILFVDAFQQSTIINFPIGINLLSTIVNAKSNYTSKVISFPNLLAEKKVPDDILLEINFETVVRYLQKYAPKIVSFYTVARSYFISLIVAKNLKKADINIKIIFAGPHVSLCSLETLESFDFIDMIAIGEGEQNVISIIDYFNNREKVENIKGICYRKGNQIVYNEPSPLLDNLDDLPMLELDKDALPSIIPIETGRGCPYNCTFCCTKTFWKRKARMKSTNRIIDEIKFYKSKYNINQFDFIHDQFTAYKKNILEFCNKIVNQGIDMEWSCSARADTLDTEIIDLMAKAGCKKILLGIETGSQRMQKIINKNLKMSEVKDTIKLIDSYDIEMQVNFIFGFPSEEEEDLQKSLSLIRFCVEELLIQEATIYKLVCFPGTQIYRKHKQDLVFKKENLHRFKYPAKNHTDFIKRYPNLFSGLFVLNNQLLVKYFYLDIFVNYIYNYFAFRTPKTMNEIITFYNNSLLNFYLEYETEIKRMATFLNKTIYYEEKLSDVREEMCNSLELFIKNNIQNHFIAQLYRFEEEIIKIALRENCNESKVQTFDYDMLLYYQKLKKKKHKCKLIFAFTEDKKVSITKER